MRRRTPTVSVRMSQPATVALPAVGGSRVVNIRKVVDVGDRLVFLFGDPHVLEGYPEPPMTSQEDPSIALIERGQAQDVFDPQVSALWIRHVLWALVYTGAVEAAEGRLARHGITATVIRTLENGILAR